MKIKISGNVRTNAPHLRKFVNYLQKHYPVKREGVRLVVKLVADEYVPFAHTDGTVGDANAVLSVIPFPSTIRIATGGLWCYPKRIMADLCHEWRHLQQFFDEGLCFKKMASEEEYHKDPLEIDANEFSKKVMKEYLLAMGNKV